MFNLDSKSVRLLDWGLAAAVLGYGIVAQSWIAALIGIAGLFSAWYRPTSRMKAFIKRAKK